MKDDLTKSEQPAKEPKRALLQQTNEINKMNFFHLDQLSVEILCCPLKLVKGRDIDLH